MGQRGFTHEEHRTTFNLDPDRPEDLSAIAALQASSTRQLDPTGPSRHNATSEALPGNCWAGTPATRPEQRPRTLARGPVTRASCCHTPRRRGHTGARSEARSGRGATERGSPWESSPGPSWPFWSSPARSRVGPFPAPSNGSGDRSGAMRGCR